MMILILLVISKLYGVLRKMQIYVKRIIRMISANPCVCWYLSLFYAAVKTDPQISMAYETNVYFLLIVYVRLVVALRRILEPGLRLKEQPLSGSLLASWQG